MATAAVKYFSGTQEVRNIHSMKNEAYRATFPNVRGLRYDGFSMIVGHPLTGPNATLPVTRAIDYKRNPSLHKCDARCQNAKGHTCECSCGGKFHGAGNC